ncbi:MAG: HNH endonuclease [Candidatus Competibacteraceae bacterium]|nr:HNH endonuclease [Candidatus Competibacteraceae bacterium]
MALSPEKTQIVHLNEGFDFLGFNIRLYATPGRTRLGTTTLTKPSSSAVKVFRQRLKDEWKMMLSWPTVAVISRLNPILRGWGNDYRVGASKRIFNQLDDFVWKRQARFAHRRHPGKAWYWRRQRFWTTLAWRDDQWVFYDKETGRHLGKLSGLPIKRHVLVRERVSPDNPAQRAYWAARRSRARNGSQQTCRLWTRQQGLCAVCQAPLENGEELNVHHVIPKHQGGTEALDNLQLVHLYCHQQHHAHEHNRRR